MKSIEEDGLNGSDKESIGKVRDTEQQVILISFLIFYFYVV